LVSAKKELLEFSLIIAQCLAQCLTTLLARVELIFERAFFGNGRASKLTSLGQLSQGDDLALPVWIGKPTLSQNSSFPVEHSGLGLKGNNIQCDGNNTYSIDLGKIENIASDSAFLWDPHTVLSC